MVKIDELHSRITTNTKEIMTAQAQQHAQKNKEIQKLHNEINLRIGVLEKWRHVLIGRVYCYRISFTNLSISLDNNLEIC